MIAQTFKHALIATTLFSGIAGLAAAQPAAQPAAPPGASANGEVIITARKREENLQKVPVAVTAVTGQQLQRQGLRTATDLSRVVPSLTVVTGSESVPTAAIFELRGQSAGDLLLTLSQAVGLYEDTVNIPHPVGANASLFDIQRLEVLKGPQGTLYGRNTTGGAVNIVTRSADYNGVHGYGDVEFGNYGDQKFTGAVNVPIIADVLTVRLAGQHWSRDGYGQSAVTGQKYGGDHDDYIGRVSVRFDPTGDFTSTTKFEYASLKTGGVFSELRGLSTTSSAGAPIGEGAAEGGDILPLVDVNGSHIFTNYSGTINFDRTKVWHVVEDASWNITDELKLRSITGYHKVTDASVSDLDGSPFQLNELNAGIGGLQPVTGPFNQPFPDYTDYDAYTQELDLSGHSFGRLDWLVGVYGSTEKGFGAEVPVVIPALTPVLFGLGALPDPGSIHATESTEKTDTWAVYTQNDLHLSDRVSLTLGARYTQEREKNDALKFDFDPIGQTYYCPEQAAGSPPVVPVASPNAPNGCAVISQSERASGISYLASFNFQITPTILLYLKTARGFRGGALQFRAPEQPAVQPETATDYEIGLKGDFFDHRLRANLAAYHTNYANKQQTLLVAGVGGAPTTILANAATAKIDGFEAELTAAPVRGLSLYGSVTYLHGDYDRYNCAPVTAGVGVPPADPTCGPSISPTTVLINASGQPFADPKWRYNVGARYEHDLGPGRLGGQLDWAWHSKTIQSALTFDPTMPPALTEEFGRSIGLLNGRLDFTLPEQQVTVALFATNLLDKKYQYPGLPSGVLGFATGLTAEPRMWGVELRKAFGRE